MKIHYVSGSRADFGLMRRALKAINGEPDLDVQLVLTGQALIVRYGDVRREAELADMTIAHEIDVKLCGADRIQMATAFAEETAGFSRIWAKDRPDVVILLGDRGEMLAAAIVAFTLGIPTIHIHGGERSGTLDEGFRHAITKLATYHFAATEDARKRIVAMGEGPETVFVVGAPGLDEVSETIAPAREEVLERFGLPNKQSLAVMVFHPVVEEEVDAFEQATCLLAALARRNVATIVLRPNSDAGAYAVDAAIAKFADWESFAVCDHLHRDDYLRVVAAADFLIGNSSSGIIESAALQVPCVNVGSRQSGRLRNGNTIDCEYFSGAALEQAIDKACLMAPPFENVYGDGRTATRMICAIRKLDLSPNVTAKRIRY